MFPVPKEVAEKTQHALDLMIAGLPEGTLRNQLVKERAEVETLLRNLDQEIAGAHEPGGETPVTERRADGLLYYSTGPKHWHHFEEVGQLRSRGGRNRKKC